MTFSWVNEHEFRRLLEESQLQNVEQALVLTNPDSSFCQNERELQYTQGHIVSGDLSGNVVAVCGIVLPRLRLLSEEQVCNLFFFWLESLNAVNWLYFLLQWYWDTTCVSLSFLHVCCKLGGLHNTDAAKKLCSGMKQGRCVHFIFMWQFLQTYY